MRNQDTASALYNVTPNTIPTRIYLDKRIIAVDDFGLENKGNNQIRHGQSAQKEPDYSDQRAKL